MKNILIIAGALGAVLIFHWSHYDIAFHTMEMLMPTQEPHNLVRTQLEHTAAKLATEKASEAQDAYEEGNMARGDELTKQAYAELDHRNCIRLRTCDNEETGSQSRSANQQIANKESFYTLPCDEADTLRFQLDASVLKQPLPLEVEDGDTIEYAADLNSRVCANSNVPCTGPNGQGGYPKFAPEQYNPKEFPVQDAMFQELVSYIGDQAFGVGGHKIYVVPQGTGKRKILVGVNLRGQETELARGGFVVKIKITKKNGG